MTTLRRPLVLTLALLAIGSRAWAQESGLDVVVTAPPITDVHQVTVDINSVTQFVTIGKDGRGGTHFGRTGQGVARVIVTVTDGDRRLLGRSWTTTLALNGSGHLDYQMREDGTGTTKQWPLVRWLSTGSTLDVVLNGAQLGQTERRKGVVPNQPHQSVWMQDGRAVCRTQFTLDYNMMRTYQCDPATGNVQVK